MKRTFMFCLGSAFQALLIITFFVSQAHATDVGGIISADTTWNLAGSPYYLTSTVQVAEEATLTIEPGVVINAQGNRLEIFGTLDAVGDNLSKITLNNQGIYTEGMNATINIQFAVFNSGSPRLGSGYCSLNLTDSVIQNGGNISLTNSSTDGVFNLERNIFIDSGQIFIDPPRTIDSTVIRNNVFYNTLLLFHNCAVSNYVILRQPILEYNTFLSTEEIVLRLSSSSLGCATATNNYWNTNDISVIDSMIYDGNDEYPLYLVEYEPILTEPHPNTPIPDFNQSPVAHSGFDQVVFDEVTLDGSASYDPDGNIMTYAWQLEYIGDTTHNRSATGVSPTISDLQPGFYYKHLTVTDNEGATNTDYSSVAAAGPCNCTASSMSVDSIVAAIARASKGQSYGEVFVTILDDYGAPVVNATVSGSFTGDFNETGSGVTDGNGIAVIRTAAEVKKPVYQFCVENVVKDSLTYLPDFNTQDCDSY